MIGRRRRRVDGEPRRRAPWWELPVLIVVAVAVAALLKTFVVQPYSIPSGSMERTLHGCDGCSGDRILTFKPVYSLDRDPHPGDIVVFRDPGGWDSMPLKPLPSNPVLHGLTWFGQFVGLVPPHEKDLVKRVIAIGGQTVKCCDASGNVQVGDDGPDGRFRSLDDASFTYLSTGDPSNGRTPFGPVTVPSGRLWVMGDHRDGSADSRAHCGGTPDGDGVICSDRSAATATALDRAAVGRPGQGGAHRLAAVALDDPRYPDDLHDRAAAVVGPRVARPAAGDDRAAGGRRGHRGGPAATSPLTGRVGIPATAG